MLSEPRKVKIMQFNVAQLLKQPVGSRRDFELNEDIARLDAMLEPVQPLTGHIRLTRIPSGILVMGTCRTTLAISCSRCLEPVQQEASFRLEEMFRPLTDVATGRYLHPQNYQGAEEILFDEALLINERHELDLGEVVRQQLCIEALQYAVCAYAEPAECEYYRESLGFLEQANAGTVDTQPVDPRWESLLSLWPGADDPAGPEET